MVFSWEQYSIFFPRRHSSNIAHKRYCRRCLHVCVMDAATSERADDTAR